MLGVRLQRRVPSLMAAVTPAVSVVLAVTALWWWRTGFRPYVVEDLGWLGLIAGGAGRPRPGATELTERRPMLTVTGQR
jgi:hypothetical protein